jgi:hypothetical protein
LDELYEIIKELKSMSQLQNERLVTPVDGCSRISFLAENLTTGVAGLFSIKMSVPDQGISYDIGFLAGRVRETQVNNNCDGDVIITRGNKTSNERSLEMTFGDDYNVLQSVNPTIHRNILISALNGGSFEFDGDMYAVIGTNGVRNIVTDLNDLDHKFYFYEDGKLFLPDKVNADGTYRTKSNNSVTAFKDNNCVMTELLYAFNDNAVKGDRFVYVLGGDVSFNEGSSADYNRYAVPATRYCDYRSIDKYMIMGVTNPETLSDSEAEEVYRLNVDMIIEIADGGVPTSIGAKGEIIAVVNSTDSTVELYLHDGTGWDSTPVTSVLGKGAMIYSTSVDTSLDGDSAATQASYVGIKTAGATGEAVCVNAKTGAGGTGDATGILVCYDWDYEDQTFIAFDGVSN